MNTYLKLIDLSIKRVVAYLVVMFSAFFVCGSAYAYVTATPLNASSSTITQGQTVSFTIDLTDFLTSGYNTEFVTSIDYLFNSGDGQTASGIYGINQYVPSNIHFSNSFTYLSAGNFTPTFSANVYATDSYTYYSYQQVGSYPYSCGFFNTCWSPIYSYVPYTSYSYLSFTTNESTSLNVISSIPEPKTYGMLLAGLGLIGFTTWRRKQNFGV